MTNNPKNPPAGTVVRKLDARGNVRAQCTMLEHGRVEYNGKQYDSLHQAGRACMADLGATFTKTCNGFVFWGLEKRNPNPTPRATTATKVEPISLEDLKRLAGDPQALAAEIARREQIARDAADRAERKKYASDPLALARAIGESLQHFATWAASEIAQ